MLQLRLMEKKREQVRMDEVNELIDGICGVVLTHLSSLPARRVAILRSGAASSGLCSRSEPRLPTSASRRPISTVSRPLMSDDCVRQEYERVLGRTDHGHKTLDIPAPIATLPGQWTILAVQFALPANATQIGGVAHFVLTGRLAMNKSDIQCPDCAAGYRRIELVSKKGKSGQYLCLICARVLEVFDG